MSGITSILSPIPPPTIPAIRHRTQTPGKVLLIIMLMTIPATRSIAMEPDASLPARAGSMPMMNIIVPSDSGRTMM